MGFSNENITWAFLCISDNCYQVCSQLWAFQEVWDCDRFSLAFSIAEGRQSLQRSNIFAGLRWPLVGRQSFLAYFIQYGRQTWKRRLSRHYLCPTEWAYFENMPLLPQLSK